jgi:hypothetical protein
MPFYRVRNGLALKRKDSIHQSGTILELTEAEAAKYHQLEIYQEVKPTSTTRTRKAKTSEEE